KHIEVTAAADPKNENTCINRVRPGVASWWTAVRTNVSNCCISPSSISSASHPKTNKAAAAISRAPRSKNTLFLFFGLSMPLESSFPREMHFSESGALLKQAVGQLPGFLYRVYVLIALALGKYRVIDRSADPKWKLQLTVFQCGSGQPRDGIGEEALLGGNLRQPAIVQFVRT